MAIRTMSASTGGGSKYSEGWHDATITKAEYGEWNNKKFLEVWFDGYGEYQTMKVWETISSKDNQEFAMARVFKYAQAGIISVLDDPTGKRPIIQFDDEASGLVGKSVSIYLYPDPKNDKYNKISGECSPIPGAYEHMSFTEDVCNSIQAGATKRLQSYLAKQANNVTVPVTVVESAVVATVPIICAACCE